MANTVLYFFHHSVFFAHCAGDTKDAVRKNQPRMSRLAVGQLHLEFWTHVHKSKTEKALLPCLAKWLSIRQ